MDTMDPWVRCNISNLEGFEGSFDGSVGESDLFELKTVSQLGSCIGFRIAQICGLVFVE